MARGCKTLSMSARTFKKSRSSKLNIVTNIAIIMMLVQRKSNLK